MSVRLAAIWSVSTQYAVFAAQFVVSVVIARFFLSPAEMGLFSVALSAGMMLSILQDFGLTRYVAGQPGLDEQRIRTCSSISIIAAGAVALLILALAWPVARFYGEPLLIPLLAVIAGSFFCAGTAIVPSALLQRRMEFRGLFVVNVGGAAVHAASALALAAAGHSAMSLAWAALAQQVTKSLLAHHLSGRRLPSSFRLAGARPILKFGSEASVLYASGSVGTRSPELIVGRILGMESVGLFGRAMGLAGHLQMLVSGAVGNVFYPAFARIRDRGEHMAPHYLRVVSGYSATVWPAMTFLAAAAPALVLLLYGERWLATAPLLLWIALSEIAFTALPLHMDIPILLGRMRRLIQLNLLDTVASIGLLLLACLWSLEAAAASRLAYGFVWFGIYAGLMRNLIGFRWRDMLAIYARSAILSLATILPLLLVYAYWKDPLEVDFLLLLACVPAGCAAWLLAVFATRHPVREEILGVLGSIGGRAAALTAGRS